MKKAAFLFFFIIAFVTVNAQSLKGSSWLITSIDDLESGKSQTIESQVKLSLKFDNDSLYSGRGCNTYNGNYKSDGVKTLVMKKGELHGANNCLGLGPLEKQLLLIYEKVT